MLAHLTLRDYAIVELLELELGPGLTVLTGETGAGKSILVDALALAIGERASADVVRTGARRCEIVAVFELERSSSAARWLTEQDLDDEERSCILRRRITLDGRSRAFINERPVPVQTLHELGRRLVDIHGQHAHQSLLRGDTQRRLLDAHAENETILERVGALYRRWSELEKAQAALQADVDERDDRLDFLRHQLRELGVLAPAVRELDALVQEQRRLSHVAELARAADEALARLDGDEPIAALEHVRTAGRRLRAAGSFDASLTSITEQIESCEIQLTEAAAELRRYASGIEADPERLSAVDSQLAELHALARKHRVSIRDLPDRHRQIEKEIDAVQTAAQRQAEIRAELETVIEHYRSIAAELHRARTVAAKTLAKSVTENMQTLGMKGGSFEVEVVDAGGREPTAYGSDRVTFRMSANAGTARRPISRVASGGELSRMSLALEVLESQDTGVPTLIFDEVDAGIGGRVADTVGRQLRKLARRHQVLCVTHLAQVASHAQQHVQVSKRTRENSTVAAARALTADQRVHELARMLGGRRVTQRSLAHAREMLERGSAPG